jgi:hypothetical protein
VKGHAKIVGNVIGGQGKDEGWDEIALAHYPSLERTYDLSADIVAGSRKSSANRLSDFAAMLGFVFTLACLCINKD